jgi:hypothetical protein
VGKWIILVKTDIKQLTESFINYINLYNYMKQQILHYPRLDTVIMVEETIKKIDSYPTKMELWKTLPKKVMYQTFSMIIDYLVETNKIIIDKDRRIVWVWNPELMKRVVKKGLILK